MSEFSDTLQKLLQQSGIKYATIADAVQYDLSYVSKWVNGKTLPAGKNIENIVIRIISCIEETALPENIKTLCAENGCIQEELPGVLHNRLSEAYQASIGGRKDEIVYSMERTTLELAGKIQKYIGISGTIALIDLFALDHEARLVIAGIRNGRFSVEENADVRFNLVIDVHTMSGSDLVYNTIFLIHMMTSLSGLDFRIYSSEAAVGRIAFACESRYSVTALLIPGEQKVLASCETEDKRYIDALYRRMTGLLSQEKRIFSKVTMEELLIGNEYIRSLISTNVKWLIGHMTEHFIPDEVYEEILTYTDFYDKEELRRLHRLGQSVLEQPNTYIMMYESAVSDFSINGELDFYNHRVILTPLQREKVLRYLTGKLANMQIRMIDSYLSIDFRHISNPCMFLSDTVCYLRLENGRYRDNIRILNDRSVKGSFDLFYEEVWNNRPDVVIEDRNRIIDEVEHYCSQMKFMSEADRT